MSKIKRILCIAFATILILSFTSCDAIISEEMLEELIVYLENLAETAGDGFDVLAPEEDNFGNDYWTGMPEDDLDDDWWNDDEDTDDYYDSEASGHYHNHVYLPETPPTCTEDGFGDGYWCDECGEIFTKRVVIPATGHSLESWVIDTYPDWNENGKKYAVCSDCGETVSEIINCSEGLEYRKLDDGTYSVVGIGRCTDTDIVIPMYYNDCKVTVIGHRAFSSNTSLTSVILPYGITEIGSSAFAWSENISFINIPENVSSIGDSAFWYCFDLTSLNIPASVTYIGAGAFGCTGMDSANDLTIEIGNRNYAILENCLIELSTGILITGFNDSRIPNDDTITAIADNAFAGCGGLTEITVPGSVKTIGASAFYCCGSLESITLSGGLESIGYNCFNACSSLTEIVIPNSVTEIGSYAFTWCTGIKKVVIGRCVEKIYSGAFNQCTSLEEIYFVGSEYDWSDVFVDSDWTSNAGAYELYFNYGY